TAVAVGTYATASATAPAAAAARNGRRKRWDLCEDIQAILSVLVRSVTGSSKPSENGCQPPAGIHTATAGPQLPSASCPWAYASTRLAPEVTVALSVTDVPSPSTVIGCEVPPSQGGLPTKMRPAVTF